LCFFLYLSTFQRWITWETLYNIRLGTYTLHRWRHVVVLWIIKHAQLGFTVIWLSIMNLHSVHVLAAPDLQIGKTTDCWNQTFPWIFVDVQLSLSTARGRTGRKVLKWQDTNYRVYFLQVGGIMTLFPFPHQN
jgi:hypothetical protein